jgi:hypothetical protein
MPAYYQTLLKFVKMPQTHVKVVADSISKNKGVKPPPSARPQSPQRETSVLLTLDQVTTQTDPPPQISLAEIHRILWGPNGYKWQEAACKAARKKAACKAARREAACKAARRAQREASSSNAASSSRGAAGRENINPQDAIDASQTPDPEICGTVDSDFGYYRDSSRMSSRSNSIGF